MRDAERALRHIQFRVVRRLDGILQGDYAGLFYGRGIDLAEVREYEPGDEVRFIDWNVTARMNKVYVRQFIEERELTAWLLLDTSASIDFGTARQLKRELVIEFAGLMAYLLTRHGDRIGAFCFADRVHTVIPPRSGRRQAVRLIHTLQTLPRLPQGRTDLAGALAQAARTIKRRSLVLVVSDFIVPPVDGTPADWQRPLKHLAQRHDVVAVLVEDPRERELPDIGLIRFEDPETGEQLVVDTSNRALRERFARAAREQRARVAAALRSAAVDLLVLSTEEPLIEPLLRFVSFRRRRRRWISSGR